MQSESEVRMREAPEELGREGISSEERATNTVEQPGWPVQASGGGTIPVSDAHQESRNRNVFIEIVPVQPRSPATDNVLRSLCGRCPQQPGKVGERGPELSTVCEIDPHGLSIEMDMYCQGFSY